MAKRKKSLHRLTTHRTQEHLPRSKWELMYEQDMGARTMRSWKRNVHDGVLHGLVSNELGTVHGSISFQDPSDKKTRYPTWDEIVHFREELLDPELGYAMYLPTKDEYVNVHHTMFHLWGQPPSWTQ